MGTGGTVVGGDSGGVGLGELGGFGSAVKCY